MAMFWRGALVAALVTTVSACGGGGGDDEGASGTGLVPAAPPLGATLYADAAVLRPMVPGATWDYAGTDSSWVSYTNTVSQAAHAVGVTESSSNTFNFGPGSVHMALVNGEVVQLDATDKDGAYVELDDVVELRSPVVVNDQYVLFDERSEGTFDDADGDGVSEAAEMALYVRVIGLEDVQLAGLPTQQAVRVDQVLVARAVMSKTGLAQYLFTDTFSTWYAPSLGVVRRRQAFAGFSGGVVTSDERLTGWAGLP